MMRQRASILWRIVGLHMVALCVATLFMPVAIYLLLRSNADVLEEKRLSTRAEVISQSLHLGKDGRWRLDMDPALLSLYERGFSGLAFAVTNGPGQVLFAAPKKVNEVLAGAPHEQQTAYFDVSEDLAVYYGISVPHHVAGNTVWVAITQNLESPDIIVDDVVAGALKRAAFLALVIFTLLLAFDIIIIRRALRPVIEASQIAAGIEPGRLDTRLPTRDLPSEILPLAKAVNDALARLETGYRHQRDFSADAAHELRTPLAILGMRVDALADREAAEVLRADIDKMSRIVEQLLQIADLEGLVGGSKEKTDLRQLSEEIVSTIAPIAIAGGKSISLSGADHPIWVNGRDEILGGALRNLIENAIHHTPAGTSIEVDVDPAGVVRVMDDGPGIPEVSRALVFRRFWRNDRSPGRGAGLGLSIVRKIAEMYDGSVVVGSRAGGGTIFTLRLALAQPKAASDGNGRER